MGLTASISFDLDDANNSHFLDTADEEHQDDVQTTLVLV